MTEWGAQRFRGRVALVTGGASGMGRETSLRLAREGAAVVAAGLPDDPRGAETTALIEQAGGRAVYIGADVSREADCEAMAQAALDHYGRLDYCVAAAGVLHARYISGEPAAEDLNLNPAAGYLTAKPVEFWEKVLAVNLTGVMLTNRAAAKRMIAQNEGGAIVNISSAAAKIPMPGSAEYSVSKAGVWMLTRCLALELAPHGIRVNTVAPGVIDTPMAVGMTSDESRRAQFERIVPLGRLGEAEDIAEAALFLLSAQSDYITGQIIHPDGGLFSGG